MTGEKPLLDTLKGKGASKLPIWLMRQAGRYLPEYRAVRAEAGTFMAMCFTPKWAAEVTLQPIRRFGFDGAIIFSDILVVPHALGRNLRVEEKVGPLLDPVDRTADIEAVGPAEVARRLEPVYEVVSRVRAALPRETTLIGFCGAPWTVATYMAEGRGSPDQRAAKLWAYQRPQDFEALMEVLVEASVAHLSAQVKAGAEAVQIFDTWAGALADDGSFERWCIAPTRALVDAFRALHPEVPVIGFPRGIGTRLGRFCAGTGVDALSVDGGTSLAVARDLVGPKVTLQGNLDPLALVAGGGALEDAVTRLLADAKPPHIFNLGHGILPETPVAHVEALIRRVRG